MSPPTPSPLPWFDPEDAPGRRDLETCIHCGLCLTACPTYRELKIEPDSPRGRIYLMRGLAEGRIQPSDELVTHLDNCLDCRACETVCPAGVPYSRMLEETRGQLQRRATSRTPLRGLGQWVLDHVFPNRVRMHLVADLLRLGQAGPIAAFVRSDLGRRVLPAFATQGFAMTPPLAPRGGRALENVARELPAGARMERTDTALRFVPAGAAKARVDFFTSCVMEVMFPELNRATVRMLVLAGAEVRVPHAQTCCGALHAHAGLRRTARRLADRNGAAFADDADFVVTNSAGCGAALRESAHLLHDTPGAARGESLSSRTRDISEVLAQLGMPEPTQALRSPTDASRPLRIGYHDPCHLAHAQKVRSAPRELLRALSGVEVVDLPNSDWCCGSAGVYNLSHPEMADAQLTQKLDSIEQVTPDVVVASNPGCLLHMARGARARGSQVEMLHLVEVLARAYPAARA